MHNIPMSSPDLTEAERQAVQNVLNTPNLSMGHWILDFEKSFRDVTAMRHSIAVSSGTSGLHLCVRAADIQAGDLVITTPFSFVASANVLLYENAVPVFVDVNPRTGNMDPQLTAQATHDLCEGGTMAKQWLPRKGAGGNRTLKAILPVDVFGQPADLGPIRKLADDNQLSMIEDACEALGAEYKGKLAGTFGDYGVYAFYPNKQITTGEGGIIVTNDEKGADTMRALRNQGRAPGDTWLQHTFLGYNYRLDEMSAALGVIQMSRLEELLRKRDRVANWYTERLQRNPRHRGAFHRALYHTHVLVCLRGTARCQSGPWRTGPETGSERSPGPPILPSNPSAALHAGTLRVSRGGFPGDGRPRKARTGFAVLGRHDGRTGGSCLRGPASRIDELLDTTMLQQRQRRS